MHLAIKPGSRCLIFPNLQPIPDSDFPSLISSISRSVVRIRTKYKLSKGSVLYLKRESDQSAISNGDNLEANIFQN